MLITFHCIARLSVCCHHVSRIGDFNDFEIDTEEAQEAFIDRWTRYHAETLDLITESNQVFEYSNLCQVLTTFGCTVLMSFLINEGKHNNAVFYLEAGAMFTVLFLYCYLSECVSSKVKEH